MIKRILSMLLVMAMAAALLVIGCSGQKPEKPDEVPPASQKADSDGGNALKDGEYTATVPGQEGDMTVKVTIKGGKIGNVEIVENHETEAVAGDALKDMPTRIVEKNSCDVDVVSGASLTSGRIKDAVKKCLDEASK